MVPHGGRPPVVVVGAVGVGAIVVGMGVGDGVGAIVIGVEVKAWAPTARAPSTTVRMGGIGLTVPATCAVGGQGAPFKGVQSIYIYMDIWRIILYGRTG